MGTLENLVRASAVGIALAVAPLTSKGQIVFNTVQGSNNFYTFTFTNNFTSGSSTLSSFYLPVFDYKIGSATFNDVAWSLTSSIPLSYGGSGTDGYGLTFTASSIDDYIQPNGGSGSLTLQTNGASAALTSQTVNYGLGGGGSGSTTAMSPSPVTPVPEPSTYGAILAGATALFAAAYRRFRPKKN